MRIMRDAAMETLKKLRAMVDGDRSARGRRLPPERELAGKLGVSRAVLRRALSVLEGEGRIWRHVGRGTFIGSPLETSPEEVSRVSASTNPAEIMEARMILEPKLASLAALRATKNELMQMELYWKKSREAIETRSFENWDELFHQSIAQATDNSLLISLFQVIQKIRQSNIWGSLKEASLTDARRKVYCRQHGDLLGALKDRNAARAEGLMREHLATIRKHLMEIQP